MLKRSSGVFLVVVSKYDGGFVKMMVVVSSNDGGFLTKRLIDGES